MELPDQFFVNFRPGPGGTPGGRDRGDMRGDPRDMRSSSSDPRGQRGDPRGETRGELRPDQPGDQRDPRRRSHGHSPNGYLPFVVEGPPRPMIAVYDYDPIELSPNVDSEVMILSFSFQTDHKLFIFKLLTTILYCVTFC